MSDIRPTEQLPLKLKEPRGDAQEVQWVAVASRVLLDRTEARLVVDQAFGLRFLDEASQQKPLDDPSSAHQQQS